MSRPDGDVNGNRWVKGGKGRAMMTKERAHGRSYYKLVAENVGDLGRHADGCITHLTARSYSLIRRLVAEEPARIHREAMRR
jgi:hypothetical protein